MTLTNSTLSGNSATSGDGGGLYNAGTATLTNSTLSGNSGGGGGIGVGGGIFDIGNGAPGNLTLTNSTVSGNTGGGIFSFFGIVTLTNSTVSGNTGGGIDNFAGTVTMNSSTVSGNSAGDGGGLVSSSFKTATAITTITNSTFSGNSASFRGGGIFNEGTMTLTNSTVSGNRAPDGGGGGLRNVGPATLTDTIVANSPSGGDCTGPGPITDGGYNLDDDTSCGFSGVNHSLPGTNPLLGALANNGGPTKTLALLSGSPAIDAGGTSANGCPATDQRGVSRPQGAACDIGAYEFVPTTKTTLTANPNPGLLDQPVQLCATVAPTVGAPSPSTGSVSFQEGATTLGTGSLNSSGTGCFTTSSLSLGDHTITASYGGSGAKGFSGSTSAPLVVSIQVQGQDVAGGAGGGGTPPYNPPSQDTGGQNTSGNGAGQTQQHQPRATHQPSGVTWLGTGLGLLLLLLGLGGLGGVFYRASRHRPAPDVGAS